MSVIDAVLLDIDGTLLYSNDQHARAFVLAAEEMGVAHPGFEAVRRMIGMGGDKLVPRAFGFDLESPRGREIDERKGRIFRSLFGPELRPTEGTRAFVERLKVDGLRVVVATSAGGEDLSLLLGRAGVEDLIDDCTSSSDVEESKPAPDLVHAAVDLAGVPADRCVMIGDTPYDVEAATRAGVRILGVRTGGWSTEELAGSVAVYDHPAAILANYVRGSLI
jgi:HAD superfamily hydrolase (TIGR01509 family)